MLDQLTLPTRSLPETDAAAVAVSTDVSGKEWDTYLSQHPEATVELLWGWREVYQRAFAHDCVYLAARRHGAVVGVLPLVRYRSRLFGRFVVSLPYFNYAGIVADDGAVIQAILAKANEVARLHRAHHVEFRHRARVLREQPCRENKVGFARQLPSTSEALWAAIDRKVRNQVRKAQKEGLKTVEGGAELIDQFYAVFAENMRDLGTPVFPKALFVETSRVFPSRARLFVVRSGEAPVAAALALTFRDTVLVPWASSLRAFRQQCPNTLLYWSVMEWAIQGGFTNFDFGRSTIGAGTAHFKEQWGGSPRQLHTEYLMLKGEVLPDQGTTNRKLASAIACWQRLPLPVANRIGPMIIRHLA